MKNSHSESYKAAGVDITAGYDAVNLMKRHVKSTLNAQVLQGIGNFGGLFMPDLTGISEPVLVSGTDGVGTKLKLAFLLDKHDTIGIDSVAMCVNDIICSGAKPMFFLDYIATGKVFPKKIESIIKGVAEGCRQANCALIGGETAEHPMMMPEDEYDIAGFSVGIVDKSKIIDGAKVAEGDVIIGIGSSGVHSNGFSLIRMVFGLNDNDALEKLNTKYSELGENCTLGQALLEPTKIYVKAIDAIGKKLEIKGISHVTGGGFYENIPRMIPDGFMAKIDGKLPQLPIFGLIERVGNIPKRDMYNTYNMGIGMAIIVNAADAENAVKALEEIGEKGYNLGKIVRGDGGLVIDGIK